MEEYTKEMAHHPVAAVFTTVLFSYKLQVTSYKGENVGVRSESVLSNGEKKPVAAISDCQNSVAAVFTTVQMIHHPVAAVFTTVLFKPIP